MAMDDVSVLMYTDPKRLQTRALSRYHHYLQHPGEIDWKRR